MTALADYDDFNPLPVLRTLGHHDRACPICGWRFFTTAGLAEHRATVDCRPPTAAQVVAWREAGRRVAAANNGRRRACEDCDMVSTPAGLGAHQKASGHTGWAAA